MIPQCSMSNGSTEMLGSRYSTSKGADHRCERHATTTPDPGWLPVRSSLRQLAPAMRPALTEDEEAQYTFKWIPAAMKEWREGKQLKQPEHVRTALDSDSLSEENKRRVRTLWDTASSHPVPTRTMVLCEEE